MQYGTKDSFVIGANRNLPNSLSQLKGENDDLEPSNVEIESLKPLEKGPSSKTKAPSTRFKKHWRRFWCCYLLGCILLLAILLPIFFMVVIPAVAQLIVNDTSLPVYSASIMDPKPDKVTFTLHTSLKIPSGLRVHTDPLNLSLFNQEVKPMEPYLLVALPAYNLKGGTNMMSVTRHNTDILNEPQFVKTLTTAVYEKRFVMSAKGSTVGHLGALKAPLTLDKNVELNGLDKFSGFSIPSARLIIPEEKDGTNLVGTAVLPNRSVFTFAMGNVTLNLQSAGLIIGQATSYNVLLRPGNNTIELRGWVDIDTVLDNLLEILGTQMSALLGGDLELSATGNSTIYDNHHIHYYEEILNNLTLTTRVPFMKLLMDTIHGMTHSNSSSNSSSLQEGIQQVSKIMGGLSNLTTPHDLSRSLKLLVNT
ncbi:hypothetical protein N7510_010761 [Penicillium lagena]|uniref:uncharacterized protein n=1 Tax=Penicillium lagena TaxID=94218 RepID=UPI00253FE09C|nr:uncharacterized protein N7510_010761 [Penicillium lagena]KAJ5601227.1 hypothetical protein N7510_010761 [Penicillium lagena]